MYETTVAAELMSGWKSAHPSEFHGEPGYVTEVPYPQVSNQTCDVVLIGTNGRAAWGIEVKRLQFVGDNGKKNDHAVQKMLSPYLKDRSVIHDLRRMSINPFANSHAVVGYAFEYSFDSCERALVIHPSHKDRIKNLRSVCKENDPLHGILDPRELIYSAHTQFSNAGLVEDFAIVPFDGAVRHPCGGSGIVFGWKVAVSNHAARARLDTLDLLSPEEP